MEKRFSIIAHKNHKITSLENYSKWIHLLPNLIVMRMKMTKSVLKDYRQCEHLDHKRYFPVKVAQNLMCRRKNVRISFGESMYKVIIKAEVI